MKLDSEIRKTLEKVANPLALGAGLEATGKAVDVGGKAVGGVIDLGKFELKLLATLLAGGAALGGAAAGMAASKLTEPSGDDMRKLQSDLANIQVERATSQLERSLMSEAELERQARKKAKESRSLRLD